MINQKPTTIQEAIQKARAFNTPTYIMLADEVERLQNRVRLLELELQGVPAGIQFEENEHDIANIDILDSHRIKVYP